MPPFADRAFEPLAKTLGNCRLASTLAQLGGLLTAPSLQRHILRLELLIHLAVLHCSGLRDPNQQDVTTWLTDYGGLTPVALLEDPPEDVFVSNVRTHDGNRRVFEGLWDANDYFAQQLVDVLSHDRAPRQCRDLIPPITALLTLSDSVANRLALSRWHSGSLSSSSVELPSFSQYHQHADAVTFRDNNQLAALGLTRRCLQPFVLREEDRQSMASETLHCSSLERRPLVSTDGNLILALPTAPGIAIRRFALAEMKHSDCLDAFANVLAAYQAHEIQSLLEQELGNEAQPIALPSVPLPKDLPQHSPWLIEYDTDKYLHVVLLHDRLDGESVDDLTRVTRFGEGSIAAIHNYVREIANRSLSLPSSSTGVTLIIVGGLGHSCVLPHPFAIDNWNVSIIGIADFVMLIDEGNHALTRYLKSVAQRRLAESHNICFHVFDDYTFYCNWREHNSRAIPLDVPLGQPAIVVVPTDAALPVRRLTRARVDRHSAPTIEGRHITVSRLITASYFDHMHSRPIYASADYARLKLLKGVVETERGASWFTVIGHDRVPPRMSLLFEIWTGFIEFFARLVSTIETIDPESSSDPLEVRLDFSEVALPGEAGKPPEVDGTVVPTTALDQERRIVSIGFPRGFLGVFRHPSNAGERLIIRSIAAGLLMLRRTSPVDPRVLDRVVGGVIPSDGIRVLHLFELHPFDYLLATDSQEVGSRTLDDIGFLSPGLATGCYSADDGNILTSKSACGEFLHKLVDKIHDQLSTKLRQLDRSLLIQRIYRIHDAVLHDRDHWRRTSLALQTIHGAEASVADVARERESMRTKLAVSARCLLELAICECPAARGRPPSQWDVDVLLTHAELMIQAATDSDAIHHGLVEPRITIHPNGEYDADRSFYRDVIAPFAAGYFDEKFQRDVESYDGYYGHGGKSKRLGAPPRFSDEFERAFVAEYGLVPDEVISGFAEVMDMVMEHRKVIVETTLGELRNRLTKRRGLSSDVVDSFIRTFTIFHRASWDSVPNGCSRKDLYPWRFRRKLSLIVRPLLAFGTGADDQVILGAGGLKMASSYLVEKARSGTLPQSLFRSTEMRSYAGVMNDRRGRAFTQRVAGRLQDIGWCTRTEVGMTELGGTMEDGDVDVLAWKDSGEIQIIECKCLYLARTVAEVAEICGRFRGEAKDELAKHVHRVNWIKEHLQGVLGVVGFVPSVLKVSHNLVTNTHVPMRYIDGLPIEPGLIGLPRWLEADFTA